MSTRTVSSPSAVKNVPELVSVDTFCGKGAFKVTRNATTTLLNDTTSGIFVKPGASNGNGVPLPSSATATPLTLVLFGTYATFGGSGSISVMASMALKLPFTSVKVYSIVSPGSIRPSPSPVTAL